MNATDLEAIRRISQELHQCKDTEQGTESLEDALSKLDAVIQEEDKKRKKEETELAELALNYWRLTNWVANANVERKMQANSSIRKIGKFLEKKGIELKDLIGQQYDDGYAADVMGVESESDLSDEELIVIETVRPIILCNGTVIKYGQVILGDKVKENIVNEELPMDPSKAIPILQKYIQNYCSSAYKDKRIVRKLNWCNVKLDKWLGKRGN